MIKNPIKLFYSILICLGGGYLSGLFTKPGLISWYPTLVKSRLVPPPFVFPIVWSILYVLMGISLYLVWTTKKKRGSALFFFGAQLFFNFIWSFIFFFLQKPGIALVDILLLLGSLLGTYILFLKISKTAAYLLIPYGIWGFFALYLNYFIYMHN